MRKLGAGWLRHLRQASLLMRDGMMLGLRQPGAGAPAFSPTLCEDSVSEVSEGEGPEHVDVCGEAVVVRPGCQ